MRFYDSRTFWDALQPKYKKHLTCDEFYALVDQGVGLVPSTPEQDRWNHYGLQCEQLWHSHARPYYNLYPAVIPMFTKLKLDIPTNQIRLPLVTLLIRFPNPSPLGFTSGGKDWQIQTIMAIDCDPAIDPIFTFENGGRGMGLWIDWGETHAETPAGAKYRAIQTGETIMLGDDTTVEERINMNPHIETPAELDYFRCPPEIIKDCFRIVCTLCLIGNNPELIEPDWLKADEDKIADASAAELAEFARRAITRKGLGWRIGAQIEKVPHYRRPHPALIRVGPGRTERKLIFRSGSLVHRDTVKAVPTGYGE